MHHPDSQGQGPARRPARQDHLREALQGCPVLPPRHSRHPRRQTKDQRFPGATVPEGPRGEGPDQARRHAQQDEDLQYVFLFFFFRNLEREVLGEYVSLTSLE